MMIVGVYGDDLAYGSRMDLGISSTDNLGGSDFVGDGLGTSNLRKPSWPYALALLLTGWAKVRTFGSQSENMVIPSCDGNGTWKILHQTRRDWM